MKTASDTNSRRLTDSDPTIADIQFCDNYLPALVADTYTITITHTITDSTTDASSDLPTQPFTQTQQFAVEGPRFSLNATDIQTQFPADKSQGQFDQQFPYIVLTKRALPWERLLQPGGDRTIPWMALLVFQESEIISESNNNGSGLANLTMTKTYPISQVVSPEAGVLGPSITLSKLDDPTSLCQAIDILPETFIAVLPRLNELKYLTHVRQIDVETLQHKAESELQGTGWFSVVMANRLPIAPSGSTNSVRNIVQLVSLEGWQDYLTDNPTFPNNPSKLRLVSLASWTFDCLAEPKENFRQLMKNFIATAQAENDPTALSLKMPSTLPPNPTPDQQLAQTILNNGYVPLTYRTRSGDQTYSWYRGPLTPVPIQEFTNIPSYTTAEAALIYDQTTGLFDQSYAVAWQTGRLLALADRSFAVSVLNWRRQTNQALRLLVHRLNSPHVSEALKQTETVAQIRQLLHPKLVSESFMHFLGHNFANELSPQVASLGYQDQPQPKPIERSSAPSHDSVKLVQQFMQQPEAPALFNRVLLAVQQQGEATSDSPTDAIPPDILSWLTRLALFYGVPFDILVPNQQMLPPESIRFFYIDPNAINSMIDGALSLGVQSSQDSLFNQLAKNTIRQAVHQSLPTIRAGLLGTTVSDSSPVTQPIAGFLLRSQVVSGFPGLEIKSYGASDGQNPSNLLEPLRMDRLTNDVLLCLLSQPEGNELPVMPAWIELNEPKESFGFGVEDNLIDLRNVTGSQPGSIIQPEIPQSIQFRSSSTVVDISLLQTQIQEQLILKGKLNNPDNIISPAEFAIQLIRAPEKMVFQNHAQSNS